MYARLLKSFDGLIGLASEFIIDKDKRIEFEFKAKELQFKSMETLVGTQTIPFVDGTVKLLYATVALFRPVASIGVFAYGLMFPEKLGMLYEIDETMGTVATGAVFGSAPAWGFSRHVEKKKEKEKAERIEEIRSASPKRMDYHPIDYDS